MLISHQAQDRAFVEAQKRDLEALLSQPATVERRPCAGCGVTCPSCGSQSCTCNCGERCPFAAAQLSSDPERFPIEAGILPLVYALSELRVLSPCWSCEGHLDAEGALHRLPSVWFSSRSAAYPSLLAELLAKLCAKRVLAHDWQVAAVHCGAELNPVFAIEPRLGVETARLEDLHRDIRTLAGCLKARLRELAAAHISRLDVQLLAA